LRTALGGTFQRDETIARIPIDSVSIRIGDGAAAPDVVRNSITAKNLVHA